MRKAVKEYRYEVDECKMSEECHQYLAQLQKDWERRRLLQAREVAETEQHEPVDGQSLSNESFDSQNSSLSSSKRSNESSLTSDPRSLVEQQIDDVFGSQKSSWNAYEPLERPGCISEYLDPRAMVRRIR